jgi:coatomer protein complex subunit epsilon
MATPDLLFNLRNLFYLGAYQSAINNSDVPGLDADAAAERDVIVFRSYIALGSYQVSGQTNGVLVIRSRSQLRRELALIGWVLLLQLVISEIDSSAATSLQAVKLLALYLTGDKVSALDLASDPSLIVDYGVGSGVSGCGLFVTVGLDLSRLQPVI